MTKRMNAILLLALVLLCGVATFLNAKDLTPEEYIQIKKDQFNRGDISAAFHIGYVYKIGEGVKKDLQEAAKWFKLGAERGDMQSALEFANLLRTGEGVQQSLKEAIKWYKKIEKEKNQMASSFAHIWLVILKPQELGLGENWKPYFESIGNQSAYIDMESIVRLPDNKVRAWSMEETPNHEWFMLWLYEIDCTERMMVLRDCKIGPSNMDLDKMTVQQKNKKYLDYLGICSMFGKYGPPSYEHIDPTSGRDTARYNMWCNGENSFLGE